MNKRVILLVVCSLIVILLIEFYLDTIPEVFPGGSDIGKITYGICASIVAGFIFYYFINYLPEKERKNVFRPVIKKSLERIYSNFVSMIDELKRDTDIDTKGAIPEIDIFIKLMETKNLNGKISGLDLSLTSPTFLKFFRYHKIACVQEIKSIYEFKEFVPTEVLVLLNKLENSVFFAQVEMFDQVMAPINNENMGTMAKLFYDGFMIAKKIKVEIDHMK